MNIQEKFGGESYVCEVTFSVGLASKFDTDRALGQGLAIEGVLGGETLEHQEGQGTGLKFFGVTYDLSVLSVTKSE